MVREQASLKNRKRKAEAPLPEDTIEYWKAKYEELLKSTQNSQASTSAHHSAQSSTFPASLAFQTHKRQPKKIYTQQVVENLLDLEHYDKHGTQAAVDNPELYSSI